MSTFYSTLAQIIATLLGILAAGVGAYFVFLQTRTSEFEDKIEHDKIAIREELLQLRTRWPWTITMYLPPEFKDAYRSRYSEKAGAPLIEQGATDLIFSESEVSKILESLPKREPYAGPWKGRFFFWILTEAVSVLTVGTPDTRTKPEGVYPSNPTGPGFDAWRKQFDTFAKTSWLLEFSPQDMRTDFAEFEKGLSPKTQNRQLISVFSEAVDEFYKRVGSVKSLISDMDKQALMQQRYSFGRRVHTGWLLIISILAFALGCIFPMILLAWKIEAPGVAATTVLLCAVLLTAGALFQFGWDISSPQREDMHAYILERWYIPIEKELEIHMKKANQGGLVDREIILDAVSSPYKQQFPSSTLDALRSYLSASESYNDNSLQLCLHIIQKLKADPTIGPLASKYKGNKGGPILQPADILNEARLDEVMKALETNPENVISVEIEMPRWSHVALKIPPDSFAPDFKKLRLTLDYVRSTLLNEEITTKYIASRERLRKAAEALRQTIKSAS